MTDRVHTTGAPVPADTGKLAEYQIDNGTVRYTAQLTEAEAKALGDVATPAQPPATAAESASGADDTGTGAKAATPANKRRSTSNK